MTKAEALRLRSIVETAAQSLDDKIASEAAMLFPSIQYDGMLILAGSRFNWNGKIKRAAVNLWNTEENNPDNAPDLWENIEYINGIRVIPAVITVGKAFANGEFGYWDDVLYISKMDNNVWTPEVYPDGWSIADE